MLVNKSMFPIQAGYNAISKMQGSLGALQTQLGSGEKTSTLAGMGADRSFSLALRGRLTKLDSYAENMSTVNLRLAFLDQSFTSLSKMKAEARTSASATSYGENNLTMASLQKDSQNRLGLALEALNANVGGRYLMGGNKTESPPVASYDAIMDGLGGAAGFKQVVSERNKADLGESTGTLGDLGLPRTTMRDLRTGSVVNMSSNELDRFGYKLTSITGNSSAVTTSGPTADLLNPAVQIDTQPIVNQLTSVVLTKANGTTTNVTLQAVAGAPVAGAVPPQYQIGTTTADSARTFQAALEKEAGSLDQYRTATTNDASIKINGETDGTPNMAIKFSGQPAANEVITISVKQPDGSTREIKFRAVGTPAPAADPAYTDYTIAVSTEETAKNFQAALKTGMGALDAPLKLGRLETGISILAPETVKLSQETPATMFGYKLSTLSTTSGNINVSSSPGTPPAIQPSMAIKFLGQPAAGEGVTIGLALPDDPSKPEAITLEAVKKNPVVGQFLIGATKEETAANFEAALKLQLDTTSKTKLTAASTYAAADDFFSTDGVPKRVVGDPATATTLAADNSGGTVKWYTGEISGNARNSATARVDDATKVGYGVRANETGLGELVRTLASMSVQNYDIDDVTAKGRFSAMVTRQISTLSADTASDPGSVESISMELGVVRSTIGNATTRNTAYAGQMETMLTEVETVSMEETAMKLLALKTRLEASYQTTASISQLSLVNYLR